MRWPYSAREEDLPTYHLHWDPSPGGRPLFAVQEAGDMSQPRHERSGLKSPSLTSGPSYSHGRRIRPIEPRACSGLLDQELLSAGVSVLSYPS